MSRVSRFIRIALAGAFLMISAAVVSAQQAAEPAHDTKALAKETQNPVSSLVSVPFQFNFNNGGDLEDRTFFNLNFQPVMPFALNDSVNVVLRMILPVNSMPGPDDTRFSGVGDTQTQIFFTPAKPGKFIWGVGPVTSLPTATVDPAKTGTFAAGVGAVVVKNVGALVLGGLVSQFWPVSDTGDDVKTDLLTVQPFINYNFGTGWALSFAPVIVANWDAASGEEWTVPLGLGLTKTTVFNRRPMNVGFQYYYNVERPEGSAGQQFRFVVALLFPTAPRP